MNNSAIPCGWLFIFSFVLLACIPTASPGYAGFLDNIIPKELKPFVPDPTGPLIHLTWSPDRDLANVSMIHPSALRVLLKKTSN